MFGRRMMMNRFGKVVQSLLWILVCAVVFSGCQALSGLGKDLDKLGKKVAKPFKSDGGSAGTTGQDGKVLVSDGNHGWIWVPRDGATEAAQLQGIQQGGQAWGTHQPLQAAPVQQNGVGQQQLVAAQQGWQPVTMCTDKGLHDRAKEMYKHDRAIASTITPSFEKDGFKFMFQYRPLGWRLVVTKVVNTGVVVLSEVWFADGNTTTIADTYHVRMFNKGPYEYCVTISKQQLQQQVSVPQQRLVQQQLYAAAPIVVQQNQSAVVAPQQPQGRQQQETLPSVTSLQGAEWQQGHGAVLAAAEDFAAQQQKSLAQLSKPEPNVAQVNLSTMTLQRSAQPADTTVNPLHVAKPQQPVKQYLKRSVKKSLKAPLVFEKEMCVTDTRDAQAKANAKGGTPVDSLSQSFADGNLKFTMHYNGSQWLFTSEKTGVANHLRKKVSQAFVHGTDFTFQDSSGKRYLVEMKYIQQKGRCVQVLERR